MLMICACTALAIGLSSVGAVMAQGTTATYSGAVTSAATEKGGFDALKGRWVRPDGGYTIAIRGIAPDGQIDALYFNPNQLPFSKAQARLDDAKLRVSFELRAGGYDGSTYDLVYDPATDRLTGVYYQAVAKQKFDVYFARR